MQTIIRTRRWIFFERANLRHVRAETLDRLLMKVHKVLELGDFGLERRHNLLVDDDFLVFGHVLMNLRACACASVSGVRNSTKTSALNRRQRL